MSRAWKPGDVAVVVDADGETCRAIRANGCWSLESAWSDCLPDDLVTDVRPLVVIDPEDREQVGRLVRLFWENGTDDCDDPVAMQAALREFANPKPPCATCLDRALAGFTCNTCGNGAES